MADIAQLGIAIDSRSAKTAATDLNSLQTAANGAAVAADKLTSASGKSGAAAKAITGATTPAVAATTALAKAADTAAHAHAGMSTQAMSAFHSIRSMTEGIALGMPPMQVLTQQLNHLSYASSGPGGLSGAFKEALRSFTGMISPAALVAGGIAAVAAVSIYAVASVAKLGKAFDDVSHVAGTTTGYLHDLQQAAAFKGIDQADFFKAMEKFGASVYDAKNNMGGLAEVMRANGKSASDFNDYLEKAADLIKNASNDQQRLQLLQQMGLPATMDWVRFLSQGADGIKKATAEAVKFGGSADEKLIAKAREFDERWNTAWSNFKNNAEKAVIQAATLLDRINPAKLQDVYKDALRAELGRPGVTAAQLQDGNRLTATSSTDSFYNGLGTGAPKGSPAAKVVDPNVLKDQISKEQQRLALLGPLASAEDAVKAKQLEINAAALNGVGISKDQAAAVLLVTRAQVEMSRVQEQAAIGINRTADATKAMNDNLQSLVARKLLDPNNPQEYTAALNSLTKQMEDLSDQAKVAGSALPQFQSALNEAASTRKQLDGLAVESMSINRSFFTEFGQNLRNGANAWDAFKTAGLNALGKLADKLMSMAADNLFANAFGGSSGGGGLLGLLGLGGGGGTMSFAGDLGAGTGGMAFPKFASGTTSAPGGLSIVGEKGPELVNLPRGAQVFNAGQTQGMMSSGNSAPPVVMNDNRVLNIGQGASADTVLQLREELARDRAARYTDTVRIVQSAKKRREL